MKTYFTRDKIVRRIHPKWTVTFGFLESVNIDSLLQMQEGRYQAVQSFCVYTIPPYTYWGPDFNLGICTWITNPGWTTTIACSPTTNDPARFDGEKKTYAETVAIVQAYWAGRDMNDSYYCGYPPQPPTYVTPTDFKNVAIGFIGATGNDYPNINLEFDVDNRIFTNIFTEGTYVPWVHFPRFYYDGTHWLRETSGDIETTLIERINVPTVINRSNGIYLRAYKNEVDSASRIPSWSSGADISLTAHAHDGISMSCVPGGYGLLYTPQSIQASSGMKFDVPEPILAPIGSQDDYAVVDQTQREVANALSAEADAHIFITDLLTLMGFTEEQIEDRVKSTEVWENVYDVSAATADSILARTQAFIAEATTTSSVTNLHGGYIGATLSDQSVAMPTDPWDGVDKTAGVPEWYNVDGEKQWLSEYSFDMSGYAGWEVPL